MCPSCGAKRAAELAAFLVDEVVKDVGHAQWVFTIPKMLRVYFLHHRELLGELSQAAAETARELLAAAAGEEKGFRPGVVSVVQTFGGRANFHPHVHALVSRGGWTGSGYWMLGANIQYWYYVASPDTFGSRHQVRFQVAAVVPLPW